MRVVATSGLELVALLFLRNKCQLVRLEIDLLFVFRSSRCRYQFFSIIPLVRSIVKTAEIDCQYGLVEDLLVVGCTLEMVIASSNPQLSRR